MIDIWARPRPGWFVLPVLGRKTWAEKLGVSGLPAGLGWGKTVVCAAGFFFWLFSALRGSFTVGWVQNIRRENHRLDAFETLGNSGKELPFPQLVSLPDF